LSIKSTYKSEKGLYKLTKKKVFTYLDFDDCVFGLTNAFLGGLKDKTYRHVITTFPTGSVCGEE